jgi:hypothetical protein
LERGGLEGKKNNNEKTKEKIRRKKASMAKRTGTMRKKEKSALRNPFPN